MFEKIRFYLIQFICLWMMGTLTLALWLHEGAAVIAVLGLFIFLLEFESIASFVLTTDSQTTKSPHGNRP